MQNCLLEVLLLLTPTGLLTTLVYLYLNAGKPTKHHTGQLFLDVIQNLMQYGEKILLLPQAQRGTSKSSSSFLVAVNYCPVDHFIVILIVQLCRNNSCVER